MQTHSLDLAVLTNVKFLPHSLYPVCSLVGLPPDLSHLPTQNRTERVDIQGACVQAGGKEANGKVARGPYCWSDTTLLG